MLEVFKSIKETIAVHGKRNFKRLTVHCSADPYTTTKTAEDLKRGHLRKGWSDIGYHVVIELDGTIKIGRPWRRNGAHVQGHNTDNFGICYIGGLDVDGKPMDTLNEKQEASLRFFMTEFVSVFGIPDDEIRGHRDWSPDLDGDGVIEEHEWLKQCPCFDIKEKMASWA